MISGLFAGVCHQLPARTLVVAGVLLPACARCAGFYLGLALAFIYYLVPEKKPFFPRHPSRGAAAVAAAALVPFVADMALAQWAPRLALGNYGRFALALFAGWGAWILLAGAASLLRWGAAAERRLTLGKVAGSLLLLLIPGILLLTPHRLAATILTGGVLAGALAFYGTLTYLPLALFLYKKRLPAWANGLIVFALAALAFAEMRWGYGWYEAARKILFK